MKFFTLKVRILSKKRRKMSDFFARQVEKQYRVIGDYYLYMAAVSIWLDHNVPPQFHSSICNAFELNNYTFGDLAFVDAMPSIDGLDQGIFSVLRDVGKTTFLKKFYTKK